MALSVCVSACSYGQEHRVGESGKPIEKEMPSTARQLSQTWETSIRPLLSKNCFDCHNQIEHSGKLEIDTIAGLMRGGTSGPAIDHQQPADSMLLEVLAPKAKKHMPPEGQLSETEIKLIANWLEDFAKDPLPTQWQSTGSGNEDEVEHADAPGKFRDAMNELPLGVNPSLSFGALKGTAHWRFKCPQCSFV